MNTIQHFIDHTSHFPHDSKVWLYAADRNLSDSEAQTIDGLLHQFSAQWQSHGKSIQSAAMLLYQRLILITADSSTPASGCSIDTSVQFLKDLGQSMNVDFMNRSQMYYLIDDQLHSCNINELKSTQLPLNAQIVQPYFLNLETVRTKFCTQISESAYHRLIQNHSK